MTAPDGPDRPGPSFRQRLVRAAVALAAVFVVAALLLNGWANAVERGIAKRTMADLHGLGKWMDAYASDHNAFPDLGERWVPAASLAPWLVPRYARVLPTQDSFGNAILIRSDASHYMIASLGKDGVADVPNMRYRERDFVETNDFRCDILFADGRFVRYPKGLQP